MSHSTDDGDHMTATIPVADDTHHTSAKKTWGKAILAYVPWFAYVLVAYVLGALYFNGPRAIMFVVNGSPVTWAETIVFAASLVCMLEIFKVSKPGIDNSGEVFVMLGFAGLQAILIALSQAYPDVLWFMRTPENGMLMVMNGLQGFVALRVNARSLVRTIAAGAPAG